MKDPREVIIRPIISEHSYEGMENNVYTFEVAKSANKIEIAQAIEAIFATKSALNPACTEVGAHMNSSRK